MSAQIDTAFVKQFSSNIFHLSQQKGSKLAMACRQESQQGESKFFERLGSVDAREKTSRHSEVIYDDTPHSRRMVTLRDFYYSDLVDEEDKLRMLISPESPYAQAATFALGRKKDDVIIAAALGNAYGGKEGTTAVSLPTSQKVAAFDGSTTTGVNLNVKTLRKVKQKFDENDVDPSIKKYMSISASQLQSLLGEDEIASADYNTIKALVQGDINTFMSFEFILTQRLAASSSNVTYTVTDGTVGAGTGTITAANSKRCIAWAQDGLLVSTGKDVFARIQELPEKHYAKQIYVKMSLNATRMEEEKVVEVICSE